MKTVLVIIALIISLLLVGCAVDPTPPAPKQAEIPQPVPIQPVDIPMPVPIMPEAVPIPNLPARPTIVNISNVNVYDKQSKYVKISCETDIASTVFIEVISGGDYVLTKQFIGIDKAFDVTIDYLQPNTSYIGKITAYSGINSGNIQTEFTTTSEYVPPYYDGGFTPYYPPPVYIPPPVPKPVITFWTGNIPVKVE